MNFVKLKLWCKDKNEWESNDWVITKDNKIFQMEFNSFQFELDKETHVLVPYIGERDMYGKEIYFKDFVVVSEGYDDNIGLTKFHKKCKAIVEYEDGGYYLKDTETLKEVPQLYNWNEIEVIGTSLENKRDCS